MRRILYFCLGTFALAFACGKKAPQVSPAAQGDKFYVELGKKELEEKHWEQARTYFKQLIDSYPRSNLVAEARIGIADSYFNQRGAGNLVLAIAEYRDFLTFFPNHPRADYAQFQIAAAYHKQINKADRDQQPTLEAVTELKKLMELYRNSLYAEKGQELLSDCYNRLANHEMDVGAFYLKSRKACRGAIARFKNILEKYPTFSRSDEVYFQLGQSYVLCRSPLEAMPYYQQLIDNYPQSSLKNEAEAILASLKAAQASPDAGKVSRKP